MRHPVWRYTLKALRKNRARTLFYILSNLLCIACVITFGTVTGSYYGSYVKYIDGTYGTYDGMLRNAGADTETALKNDPRIQKSGKLLLYGASPIRDSLYDEKVIVGSMDKEAQALSGLKLLNGRLPERAGEIALEKTLCSKLRLSWEAGYSASFDITLFNPASESGTVTATFTVVGIIGDYSKLQSGAEYGLADTDTLPNALVDGQSAAETFRAEPVCDYLVSVDPKYNANEVLNEYLGKTASGNPAYLYNAKNDLSQNETLNTGKTAVMFLLASVMAVAVVMGLFFIVSSYLITKNGRHGQLYLLKLAGASNGQLSAFIALNAAACFILSLPFGIALGVGGGYAVSHLMLGGISFYAYRAPVWIVALSAAAALLVDLIAGIVTSAETVGKRPIGIIREGKPKRELRGTNLKIKNPMLLWGAKSAVINSPSATGIIMAFAVCFTAFVTGSAVCRAVILSMTKNIVSDYEISVNSGQWFSTLRIPMNASLGINDEDEAGLLDSGETSDIIAFKDFPIMVSVENGSDNENYTDNAHFKDLRKGRGDIEKQYKTDLEKYDYSAGTILYKTGLYGADGGLLKRIISGASAVDGTPETEALKDGKNVIIVCRDIGKSVYKAGDKINLTQLIRTDTSDPKNLDVRKVDFTVTVSAVVEIGKKDAYLDSVLPDKTYRIMRDVDAFGKVGLDARYNEIMIKLKDSGKYGKTEELLSRLKAIYPDFKFESRRENSEETEMIKKTVRSVYVSIAVLIAVFGLLSIYTAQRARLQEQKRVWGSLRAVGTEKKHAYLYLVSEITLNMLFAWVFALLVSIIVAYVITLQLDANIAWYTLISWPGAVGALLVFEALGLGVALPQMNGIFKKSIVGLISYE